MSGLQCSAASPSPLALLSNCCFSNLSLVPRTAPGKVSPVLSAFPSVSATYSTSLHTQLGLKPQVRAEAPGRPGRAEVTDEAGAQVTIETGAGKQLGNANMFTWRRWGKASSPEPGDAAGFIRIHCISGETLRTGRPCTRITLHTSTHKPLSNVQTKTATSHRCCCSSLFHSSVMVCLAFNCFHGLDFIFTVSFIFSLFI